MDWREIAGLGAALDDYLKLFDGCFARSEGRGHLRHYVSGQLSALARKSVEPMADHAGIPPRTLQDFLCGHRWDHGQAWQVLRCHVAAEHADEGSIGIIDETSFAKCGDKTVGVQRQYCGASGKIDNCVVSVHLGYSWEQARCQCVLAGDLYVPAGWLKDTRACVEAGVPESLVFREKWRIALDLIQTALRDGVRFGWLTFDEGYGNTPAFLLALQNLGQRYVAEVPKDTRGWLTEPAVLQKGAYQGMGRPRRYPRLSQKSLPPCTLENLLKHSPVLREVPWQTYHIKDTDKGPLVWKAKAHRFYMKLPVAGADHNAALPSTELWLIVARNPLTGETKYFISNAAAGVPLEQLLKVAFGRWHIERCFQDQKGELGLDHFECRRYVAVQRHLLITAISHLFLTQMKRSLERRGEKPGPDDVPVGAGGQRIGRHARMDPVTQGTPPATDRHAHPANAA
jgi:SRSO17 transposase